jgi:hypothetical protein
MAMDDTPVVVIRSMGNRNNALGLFSSSGEWIGEIAETKRVGIEGDRPSCLRITVDVSPRRVVTLDPWKPAVVTNRDRKDI